MSSGGVHGVWLVGRFVLNSGLVNGSLCVGAQKDFYIGLGIRTTSTAQRGSLDP